MVIPLEGKYGVSLIKSGLGVSLHLIHVFSFEKSDLLAKDFQDFEGEKGTFLESSDEKFPFPNPLKTKDAISVFEFFIEAKEWANRRIQEEGN